MQSNYFTAGHNSISQNFSPARRAKRNKQKSAFAYPTYFKNPNYHIVSQQNSQNFEEHFMVQSNANFIQSFNARTPAPQFNKATFRQDFVPHDDLKPHINRFVSMNYSPQIFTKTTRPNVIEFSKQTHRTTQKRDLFLQEYESVAKAKDSTIQKLSGGIP